jgi:Ca2+-binding RTX toxin-like protein
MRTGLATFGGSVGSETASNFENAITGNGDDQINGTDDANVITTNDGNDQIYGLDGADTINAGFGDDYVSGGVGLDSMDGGAGIDTVDLTFNTGRTIVDVALGTVKLLDEGDAIEIARNFESFELGNGDDVITGSANGETISGGGGDDTLNGGGGDDFLLGGAGLDKLHGGSENDILEIADDVFDGEVYDGGLGSGDELRVSGEGVHDLRLATVTGIERITFDAGSVGPFKALFLNVATIGTGIARNASITFDSLGASHLGFEMGTTSSVKLDGLIFTNEGADDDVEIAGDASDEAIVATRAKDSIHGDAGNDTLYGIDGDDQIDGGAGTDQLEGGLGNDTLIGGLANDTLTGGLGLDRFVVDAGTDTVTDLGLDGADVLMVSAGATANATLAAAWTAAAASSNDGTASLTAAGFGANLVFAGGGNGWFVTNAASTRGVTLTGSNGNDSLTGGGGADILTGGLGDDRLIGGLGVDRFIVDAGTDRVTDLGVGGVDRVNISAGATASVTVGAAWVGNSFTSNNGTARLAAANFDVDLTNVVGGSGWSVSNSGNLVGVRLEGSNRADTLTGGEGADSLVGGLDADTLVGGGGDDVLTGNLGNDRLTGGLGLDRFLVDAGTDTLTDLGLGGADVLVVSAGAAAFATLGAAWTATAGTLNDGTANLTAAGFSVNLAAAGGASAWFVSNAASTRGVTLTGSNGNDSLAGGSGADILTGGLGDDRLTGGLGLDRFIVDAGTDRITDLGLGAVDRLNISAGATASATLGAAWVANSFTANNGTARLAAAGFDVDLTGVVGASGWSVSNSGEAVGVRLTGSVRNDVLTGGNGNDSLIGGLDHDTLSGGAGDDELTGGQGYDRLIGGQGVDRFVVDVGRDSIGDLGVGGADALVILAGAQAVAELGANWVATAANVNDGLATLTAAGFSVDLSLAGGASGWVVTNAGYAAGVSLVGAAGADSLTGGNGNDTLSGGLGSDVLRARSGADTFVFGSAAAADGDVIVDFVASQGDRLDLRLIDADAAAGDQAFSFIGGAAFAPGVPGQLRFAAGLLQGDVNGDGVAEFQVQMTGVTSLSAASIWL